MARGKSRSPEISSIVEEAHRIAESGVKEVVLTGVNIGDFGKGESGGKKKAETFLELITALDEVEGIERFRISSIEPNLLSEDIIRFVAASQRFAPHFHIPLQSGSNDILRAMRRRYLRELYAERVAVIKNSMPHCCIGVDVIVGFPGETDEHFLETYQFLNELDISYLHVFTYSERPNTIAATMSETVPMNERKKRSAMLRNLSVKKRRSFYEQHIGKTRAVLFESENDNGFINGFTDNYIKVRHEFDENLVNSMIDFNLDSINANGEAEGKVLSGLPEPIAMR